MTNQQFKKCIDACIECATTCNHCAVSCLEEKEVQYLTKCIRLDLECAVICRSAAELMSLNSSYSKDVCQLCATICNACAQICEQHANMGMEHCRECAEACRACAKETMEVYKNLDKQNPGTKEANQQFVQHDECDVISRAAAELISLGSGYIKEITQLNETICNASAKEFEKHINMVAEHFKEHAAIATEAHQDLATQDQKKDEGNLNESEKNNEPTKEKGEVNKKKKKHSSALLAASLWRSPTSHSLLNVNRDVRGSSDLANTGPYVNYE